MDEATQKAADAEANGWKLKQMLDHKQSRDLIKKDQKVENYMIRSDIFDKICKKMNWIPAIDAGCDLLGGNSLCAAYYDVSVDFLE